MGPNKGFERFWQPRVWKKVAFSKKHLKVTWIPKAIIHKERLVHPRTKRTIIHYHANTLFKLFQGRPWATTLENCWGVILDMGPNKGFERFWQPWIWKKVAFSKKLLKVTWIPKAIIHKERLVHPRTKRTIIHYHANTLFKLFQGRPWATTLENCWGVIFDLGPNKGFERFLAALGVEQCCVLKKVFERKVKLTWIPKANKNTEKATPPQNKADHNSLPCQRTL